jgi:hypothetical protein
MKQQSLEAMKSVAELGEICAQQIASLDEQFWDLFAMLVVKGHARLLDERRQDLSPEQRDERNSQFIVALADEMMCACADKAAVDLHSWPSLH